MTLRRRDRIALGVVLILGLLGAYYMLALKPERAKVTALAAQITTQRQALATAQQNYATGKAAQASLAKDGGEWSALQLAVPAQSNIPALLRTLEKTAATVKVKMQAITLSGGATAASASTATPGTPTAPAGATPVPIQLTFSGGYAPLNNLVRRLTGLVSIDGGKVKATGPLLSISNVSLGGSPKLSVQLTAAIYQLPAASTAATTTTGGH